MTCGKIGKYLIIAAIVFITAASYAQSQTANNIRHSAAKNKTAEDKNVISHTDHSSKTEINNGINDTEKKSDEVEPSEYWPPFFGYKLKITDSLMALFTLGLLIATVKLWCSTDKLWIAARKQRGDMLHSINISRQSARAAEKAANAANKSANAAINIELPILKIVVEELISVSSPFTNGESFGGSSLCSVPTRYSGIGHFKYRNYGRTPAFPFEFGVGWKVADRLPETPVYSHITGLNHATVIRPASEIPDEYTAIDDFDCCIETTESEIAAISSGTSCLWFYGYIRYRDFMNDERIAKFCWRWANRNPAGHKPYYFFQSDGNPPKIYTHNE